LTNHHNEAKIEDNKNLIGKIMKKQIQRELEAIHKHDLRILLRNLNLLNDFEAKKIRCQFCKDIIQENNFGAIYSRDKKIFFSCSKLKCLANLSK